MTRTRHAAILLALTLAACGGQAATSDPDAAASTDAGAPAATEEAPAASDAAPTEAPADSTPAPTEAAGGGSTGGGAATADAACGLITPEEAGGVLGKTLSITMDQSDQPVTFCIYADDTGNAVLATSLMPRGGSASFSVALSGSGVEKVAGLGDDAAFDASSASLFVLVGDAVLSVVAGDGREPEAQRREWAQALAEIAVPRMG